MRAMNLESKLATFREHWQPRRVCQFNGHDIMDCEIATWISGPASCSSCPKGSSTGPSPAKKFI